MGAYWDILMAYIPNPLQPEDPEGKNRYLAQELEKVADWGQNLTIGELADVFIDEPIEPGSVIVWTGTEFQALNAMVSIGYGGIHLTVAIAGADVGAGWVVVPADAGLLTNPVNVVQDFANNGIRLDRYGIWQVNILLAFAHDSDPGARAMEFQIYNATTDTAQAAIDIPIARNQTSTYFSVPALLELTSGNVDDLYQLRLTMLGAGTLTGVILTAYQFSTSHVSEFVQ
jgi:hypothetical protein